MLITLIACTYITAVCWTWGYLLIKLLGLVINERITKFPPLGITCFLGLSFLAVISGYLSLFMPLGGPLPQILILLPSVAGLIFDKDFRSEMVCQFRQTGTWNKRLVFILCCLLLHLVLVMNAWTISHPDTLGYHLQTAQWIEDFRAVPGIVHLNIRLGYQGLWYVLCALFSFKFTGSPSPTFINSAVCFWYILFIAKQIDISLGSSTRDKTVTGILLILLLAINLLDYGQIRLLATSLSPDFIAAIYVMLVFYLLFGQGGADDNNLSGILICFLCFVAISIKLSNMVMAAFAMYAAYRLLRKGSKKRAFLLCAMLVITITPFIARNIITTGYVAFPSSFPDLVNPDWKYAKEHTDLENHYITAYARIGPVLGKQEIEAVNKMAFASWIPRWWANMPFPQKILIISLILSVSVTLTRIKKLLHSDRRQKIILGAVVSFAALTLWFLKAPDPRFAYGFIISLQGICLYLLFLQYPFKSPPRLFMRYTLIAFCLLTSTYTAYRYLHYFKANNFVRPEGVLATGLRTEIRDGHRFSIATEPLGCGDAPIPCTSGQLPGNIVLRTNRLVDGFMEKKN